MSLVSDWLRLVRRWISSEMSTAESSCTKRSSSMRVSSSAIGCSNSRKVVFIGGAILAQAGLVLYRHRVERAPEVPGGDRAPGAPAFTKLAHPRQRDLSALEVGDADPLLQPEVVEREHVGPQQVEHQEHLGGPAADAAHVGELGDDLLVAHPRPVARVDLAVDEVLREVGDVLGLAVRQAASSQLGSFSCKNTFRVD